MSVSESDMPDAESYKNHVVDEMRAIRTERVLI